MPNAAFPDQGQGRYPMTPAAERALAAAARRSDASPAARLLGALLDDPDSLGGKLLATAGVEADALEVLLAKTNVDAAETTSVDSMIAAPWLRSAWRFARESDIQQEIGTEHLLLGLLAREPAFAEFLADHDLDEAAIRSAAGCEPIEPADETPLPWPEEIESPDAAPPPKAPPSSEPSGSVRGFSPPDAAIWRILDAAGNRCTEGMRVVEDYVRFALDDASLTQTWKSLRHELTEVLLAMSSESPLTARAVAADVGRELVAPAALARRDLSSVARANCARVKQSLRSLEEFAKLIDADAAARIERVRYAAYAAEQATLVRDETATRIEQARLYVLLDGRASESEFRRVAEAILDGGADVVQLRDKSLNDRDLVNRAKTLVELTRRHGAIAIVNDRPDVAAASGADGVHVGQDEASVADCRRVLGAGVLVGVSTHSIEQLRQAIDVGASYVGLGPTFPSPTKRFDDFPGLGFLRAAARVGGPPAFAIGGIDLTNLEQILATGIERVAIGSAVIAAADPAAAANAFSQALKSSRRPPADGNSE